MKKVASIALAIGLIIGLSACGTQNTVVEDESEMIIEPTEEIITEPETTTEALEEDNMAFFRIENPEMYSGRMILNRDGEYYLLQTYFKDGNPPHEDDGFGCHFQVDHSFHLYNYRSRQNDIFLAYSHGEVPKVTISKNDLVIMYSSEDIPTIEVAKISFYGYCLDLDIFKNNEYDGLQIFYHDDMYITNKATNLEVKDSNGNLVEDPYNLVHGGTYTVSWFTGTEYHEETFVANCEAYHRIDESSYTYNIEGQLTKNGYAEYDLTSIEPGYYIFFTPECSCLLEVTE